MGIFANLAPVAAPARPPTVGDEAVETRLMSGKITSALPSLPDGWCRGAGMLTLRRLERQAQRAARSMLLRRAACWLLSICAASNFSREKV